MTIRRLALGLAFLASTAFSAAPEPIRVATFDSGFGGYLTAKSIEAAAGPLLRHYDASITIHHYGDTRNLPYGEKTPEQIAALGSAGVLKAFREGADMVFIACNTASTQCGRVQEAVDQVYPGQHRPVVSIIDVSTMEARRRLDLALAREASARLAILATPATVKSMTYPRRLALLYGAPIHEEPALAHPQPRWFKANGDTITSLTQKSVIELPGGKRVEVFQLAPANWVELIEHGAGARTKREAVRRDLGLLLEQLGQDRRLDVVGYFCTHFPIFHKAVHAELAAGNPGFISQGELMAGIFRGMAEERLKGRRRQGPLPAARIHELEESARPSITISGHNGAVTRKLARTVFPHDPSPVVVEEDLGTLTAGKP